MKKLIGFIVGAVLLAALGGIGYSTYSLNSAVDQSATANTSKEVSAPSEIPAPPPQQIQQSSPQPEATLQAETPISPKLSLDIVEKEQILEQLRLLELQKKEAYAIHDRQRLMELSEETSRLRIKLRASH